jgi:hypothetical protein
VADVEPAQCVTCERFSFKDKRRLTNPMKKHGFGNCAALPIYTYVSPVYWHECASYVRAKDMDKRQKWLKENKE